MHFEVDSFVLGQFRQNIAYTHNRTYVYKIDYPFGNLDTPDLKLNRLISFI